MRVATLPEADRAAVTCCGSLGLKESWVVRSVTEPPALS